MDAAYRTEKVTVAGCNVFVPKMSRYGYGARIS